MSRSRGSGSGGRLRSADGRDEGRRVGVCLVEEARF